MQVRRIIGPSGVFCLTLAVAVPLAAEDIPREQHPWGRFAPGSWTRLKVTIDSLAEAGTKTARVEFVTTRLVKVDVHGVTLAVEIRRGKEVTVIPPQAKRWDGTSFDGERKQRLSLGEVKILGRSATCQTHEVTVVLGKTRTMTKSWYSPDVAPYFLKQLVRISGEMPRHTAMEVIKLNASRQVGSRKLVGWEARTTVADRTGRTQTISFHSLDIPGGLVASEGDIRNREKARVGRRIVMLDAFHVEPVQPNK